MDTSEYLSMFLAESREHLEKLNLAVIRIEERPDDRDTLDEIFRSAHSLKGMSATMGFGQVAALTHKMEDVFEVLRERPDGVPRSTTDVLFECLDVLSAAIESIAAAGSEQLEPDALIARLAGLIEAEPVAETKPTEPDGAALVVPQPVLDAHATGRVLHVCVQLDAAVLMPSVRAYMVLAAVGDHGRLVHSQPEYEQVESFDGRRIDAWVASEHELGTLHQAVSLVADVASADVREFEPEQAAGPAPSTQPGAGRAPAEAARIESKNTSATVRVDAERLDQLMHLMGELVVDRTAVESLASQADVAGLSQAVADLTRSSQALQTLVMQVRMIPVEVVFLRFPRLVRDLSGKLGKQVELVLTGRETELDRTVVDTLGDPLVHLVRNSLDHALEPPEERRAAGKPETGTLEIAARHAGGNVVITVRDDGRGIDPARVAGKAVERGLIPADQAGSVDMVRAVELLFSPGFSTAEQTSDISGRGVGMDAVRTAIRELGGALVMTSELGQGTCVQIRLPLTLAIMPALLVEAGGTPLAIPLDRVERTLNLSQQVVRLVTGNPMLVLSDGVLPLLELSQALGYPGSDAGAYVVIARGNDRRLALVVDDLVGQRELVTRPLPAGVGDGLALSGGAVLADGSIALIVDCDQLAETGGRRLGHPHPTTLANAA
ncbi:MAG: two-component system, chemotaxis family, sensor kinase CheA [Gaiellales bacterium]|nr:two-component system, chemotaxis family, sensor kinase CheA [Gaiellales bacterium]